MGDGSLVCELRECPCLNTNWHFREVESCERLAIPCLRLGEACRLPSQLSGYIRVLYGRQIRNFLFLLGFLDFLNVELNQCLWWLALVAGYGSHQMGSVHRWMRMGKRVRQLGICPARTNWTRSQCEHGVDAWSLATSSIPWKTSSLTHFYGSCASPKANTSKLPRSLQISRYACSQVSTLLFQCFRTNWYQSTHSQP